MREPVQADGIAPDRALVAREHAMNVLGDMHIQAARDRRAARALVAEIVEQRSRAGKAEERAQAVEHLQNQIDALQRSWTYRLVAPIRSAAGFARRALNVAAPLTTSLQAFKGVVANALKRARCRSTVSSMTMEALDEPHASDLTIAQQTYRSAEYAAWRPRFVELDAEDRQLIDHHIAQGVGSSISVLVRVDTPQAADVASAIAGLRSQILTDWSAWISLAPCCETEEIRELIARHLSQDERLRLADDRGLSERQWDSSSVVLTTSSTTLHEHALYLFAEAASSGAQLLYADAELRDDANHHLVPIFKPEYSPIYQEATGYIGDTIMVANVDTSIRKALTGIDLVSAGAPAVLQLLAPLLSRNKVRRVPFVVQTTTREMVGPTPPAGDRRAPIQPKAFPATATRVTIVIPTRNGLELLQPCITSIVEKTAYPRELVEIIVVDNGSSDPATLAYLDQLSSADVATVLRDPGEFNYPRLNNLAADIATGEVLILLNNDTTVIDPNWVTRLVGWAVHPTVGAVGGKLLYPDGSVQHGGVVLGVQGVAAHVNHKLFTDDPGYEPVSDFTHETSAVTAACLAIRTAVYKSLGGLDERLAVAFNDIDLCCAALACGLTNIYIGDALATHHESKSRGYDVTPQQVSTFFLEAFLARSKHTDLYRHDAFYNPNWSFAGTHGLASPSRASRPWRLAHRRATLSRTILMLFDEGDLGRDMGLVVDLQARHLVARGHRVIVGRPESNSRLEPTPYEQATINDEFQAADYAVVCNADMVLMHSDPFYGVPRWIGDEQLTVAIDYGARPAHRSTDPMERLSSTATRKFGMALAGARIAVSEPARDESPFADTELLLLGNDHLGHWSEALVSSRTLLRVGRGWQAKLVVLFISPDNDSRETSDGTDTYFALAEAIKAFDPTLAEMVVFVLVNDRDQAGPPRESCAVTVLSGLADIELGGLLTAADLYVDTSAWHGRGLGVDLAKAYGLPVLATDVAMRGRPGVTTADSIAEFANQIARATTGFDEGDLSRRVAQVVPWSDHLTRLCTTIEA